MNRLKRRVAVIGALAVLLAGFSAATSAPSASGQGGGGGITAVEISDLVEPLAGWSGHAPTETAAEAGINPTPVTPTDAEAAEAAGFAESVIGPDGRVQVSAATTYPNSAVGQIEFFQDSPDPLHGGNFTCTGWLIDSNSVLTAGHCAFDPEVTGPDLDPAIESATWYPGRNGIGSLAPLGSCPVTTVWAPPTEWVVNQQPYYDFAVMNFANPGPCQDIDSVTGTFGLFATPALGGLNNVRAKVQGYPGDRAFGTHWRMGGRIHHANKRFTFYPMDTAEGQSGSPVWWNRTAGACTGPCGYAVHAYGVGVSNQPYNGGPRLTQFRLGQIADFADNNGT